MATITMASRPRTVKILEMVLWDRSRLSVRGLYWQASPAKPRTSHLLSHVIIRVLHRQVLCVSDVVQLCVGGDEDELADSTGRQLSMDD
jgi:hypothetical protein